MLPLSDLAQRLPLRMVDRLHMFAHRHGMSPDKTDFPYRLEEIVSDEILLATLGVRLTRVKILTDLITDPPTIFIDERRKLFFYRSLPVLLRPITLRFLLILAKTPEEFVTRNEIFERLWPEVANYHGTNKPYEAQVSDHKCKLTAEIKRAITGKVEIAADEMETFISTRKKLGYMLNFTKENIFILKKKDFITD
jgi:DNA-binding response OmpR family regulator